MARKPRLDLIDVPQHIVQRGNNRGVCFASNEDFAAYAYWLKEASQRAEVDIHAWVFMTNHVHLLATPRREKGVSRMMQYLGGRYVPYFNHVYKRSGTLWEGRFKSCLIDSERYVLECYRYIELNPVRAGMVKEPSEYRWSSYTINALGKASDLCTAHAMYQQLGRSQKERYENYRDLFAASLDVDMITDLRFATQKGLVLGRDDFKLEVEELVGRKIGSGRQGRPRKVL